MENLLTYCELRLSYRIIGSGTKVLLAFHGFGRKPEDFDVFANSIGSEYTIYAFALFHHGDSYYPPERTHKNTLKKVELVEMIRKFLDEQSIERFSLMGYSIGGKVALTLVEGLADRTDELFLLAPDGIKVSRWYKFASHTWFGIRLYRGIIKRPKTFLRFVRFLRRVRIINAKLYKYVMVHMDTHENRQLVYDVWMTFRNIEPTNLAVLDAINSNKVNCYFFFGKYDHVIPAAIGERFVKRIEQKDCLHILEAGHMLLTEATNAYIMKHILPELRERSSTLVHRS